VEKGQINLKRKNERETNRRRRRKQAECMEYPFSPCQLLSVGKEKMD
jgi:hypothetical protein